MSNTMWIRFRVQWDFLTKLCASVPADPQLREVWLESRQPKARPPNARSLTEINEEVLATIAVPQDEEVRNLLVFQRVNGTCVMRAATIKAHIKDCARVLSNQFVGSIQGERAFSTRVINGVYPDERVYFIPILHQDGATVREADGRFDKAVHVWTVRGSMSAIKTIEYVEGARLEFVLKVLTAKGNKPSVGLSDLQMLFEYGGVHGYAGERGDGEGRYLTTIEQLDREGA